MLVSGVSMLRNPNVARKVAWSVIVTPSLLGRSPNGNQKGVSRLSTAQAKNSAMASPGGRESDYRVAAALSDRASPGTTPREDRPRPRRRAGPGHSVVARAGRRVLMATDTGPVPFRGCLEGCLERGVAAAQQLRQVRSNTRRSAIPPTGPSPDPKSTRSIMSVAVPPDAAVNVCSCHHRRNGPRCCSSTNRIGRSYSVIADVIWKVMPK